MTSRLCIAVLASMMASGALADVSNLDSGLPTEIEDAQPIEHGEKAMQLITRWDRTRAGTNLFVVEPQLQWGFAPRWQAALTLHALGGTAEKTNSGDVRLQLMRQLADEQGLLPAVAAFLRLDAATGRDSRGLDTTLRLAATKSIAEGQQLHANLVWTRNAAPAAEERSEIRRLLFGYSVLLGERTLVVADVIREEERTPGAMASILELGLRRALARETTLSLGLGTGRGSPDAPRLRLIAGLERSF